MKGDNYEGEGESLREMEAQMMREYLVVETAEYQYSPFELF